MKMQTTKTGLGSRYERGDKVETPLGTGTIDTDPDERGRCMVVPVKPLADGTKRFTATTFQFGRIIRKGNAKGKQNTGKGRAL